ncbi:MAG: hypothetical protein OEM81_08575, partial [Acidimicrobiia bacterium]|nr:hypothetical protein [Acidimicrobiia bacterium]
ETGSLQTQRHEPVAASNIDDGTIRWKARNDRSDTKVSMTKPVGTRLYFIARGMTVFWVRYRVLIGRHPVARLQFTKAGGEHAHFHE